MIASLETSSTSSPLIISHRLPGKWVVLVWFKHACPYTPKHYVGAGNTRAMQRNYTARGRVWLSMDSPAYSPASGMGGYTTVAEADRLTSEKRRCRPRRT